MRWMPNSSILAIHKETSRGQEEQQAKDMFWQHLASYRSVSPLKLLRSCNLFLANWLVTEAFSTQLICSSLSIQRLFGITLIWSFLSTV